MSLVVLRSWSDGQPKVKGIAPPDSDEKDQIIIPDHLGRFVTEEKRKKEIVPNPEPTKQTQMLPKLVGPGSSSSRSYSSSPSPTPPASTVLTHQYKKQDDEKSPGPGLMHKLDGLSNTAHSNLSRCSSVQSGTESPPPSSPVCGSRYKSLGPELSATIPRRQIIRQSWIRDSGEDSDSGSGYAPLTKKEMSKSTPSLLNFNDDSVHFQLQGRSGTQTENSNNFDIRHTSPTLTTDIFNLRHNKQFRGKEPELSLNNIHLASFKTLEKSPPASVVEVIKKRPSIQTLENIKPPPKPARVTFDLEHLKNITGNPKKKYKVTNKSASADFQLISNDNSLQLNQLTPEPKLRKHSLPTSNVPTQFSTVKDIHLTESTIDHIPKLNFDTNTNTSIEERTPSPFQVHKVLHPVDRKKEVRPVESEKIIIVQKDLNSQAEQSEEMSGSILKSFQMFKGPNDGVIAPSRQAQFKHHQAITFPTGVTSNHYGTNHKNGTAWAQVPLQCINPHVFFPPQPFINNNISDSSDTSGPSNIINDTIFPTNIRRDEKLVRKNFCDELLNENEVVLQVPTQVNVSPHPELHQQSNSNYIHDGILMFDEEEEDEFVSSDIEDETESTGVSERENSFEYMSVFHNVKVGSINDLNKDSSITISKSSELTKIIGLDLGSTFSRHCVLSTADNKVKLGEIIRSLVTADGLKIGPEALPHSLSSNSRLIYYWRARQQMSYQYDLCYEEDLNNSLETLLRHYNELILASPSSPSRNTVQWNLSVHSSMSKKIVREAAYNSGLIKSTEELRLINESTAAAVTAFKFLEKNTKKWGKTFLSVNIGSTFIHTSGYEVQPSNTTKTNSTKLYLIERSDSQIYESPESSFIELFSRLFSKEFLLKYESCFGPSWIEILIRFDEMKRLYFTCQTEPYMFLPISFFTEFYRCTGIQVPECLEENPDEGISWNSNGALKFSKDLLEEWNEPSITFVKTKLKIKSYDSIVLSGGGSTDFVAKELGRLLPFVHVFLVDEPELAVVRGLVKIESSNITFKSPFSIGVGVMTPFDESVHPREKCVTRQGKNWCSDVWDSLIRKGDYLTLGQIVLKRSYVGAQPGQNVLVLPIFKSDVEDPKLVTSPSVEKCCELRFEIDQEKSWREVQLIIKCFESELSITATGKKGEINHVSIDL